jgi:mono/diheme cytochrome c family protein
MRSVALALTLFVGTAAFPAAVPTGGSSSTTAAVQRQEPDGRMLYLKNCRTCHGATGEPSAENRAKYAKIKALNKAEFLATISDDSLLTVLKKGKGEDMKSWGDKLDPKEMAAVIKYVRTLPNAKK